ncbi:MAG: hypothetical protein AAF364_19855, partial [Pseudomonadota bacterium]
GVLEALMVMIRIELERLALVNQEETSGRRSLRRAFRKMLRPMVQLRNSQPWGADAVRFLSRLVSEQDNDITELVNDNNSY